MDWCIHTVTSALVAAVYIVTELAAAEKKTKQGCMGKSTIDAAGRALALHSETYLQAAQAYLGS